MTTTNPRPRRPALADRLWANARRGRAALSPAPFSATRPNARRADRGLAAQVDLLEPRVLLSAAPTPADPYGDGTDAADFLPDVADLLVSDDFAADFAAFDGSAYADHVFADAADGEGHAGAGEGGARSFSVTFDLDYDRDVDLTNGTDGDGGWSFSEVLTLTYEIIEVWADDGGGSFTTTHTGGLSYQYHGAGFAAPASGEYGGQSRNWSLTSSGDDDAATAGEVFFDPAEGFGSNGSGVATTGTGSVAVNESFVDSAWWSNESGSLAYDAGGVTWASNWNAGSEFESVHDTTASWSYGTIYAADRPFNASETDYSGDGHSNERFAATDAFRSAGHLTSRTEGAGDAARVVSNGGSYADTAAGGTTYAADARSRHVEREQLYERESADDPATAKAGGAFLRLTTASATPLATTSYSSVTNADFSAAGLGGTVTSAFATAWNNDADPPAGWAFDEDPGAGSSGRGARGTVWTSLLETRSGVEGPGHPGYADPPPASVGGARSGATYTSGGRTVRGRAPGWRTDDHDAAPDPPPAREEFSAGRFADSGYLADVGSSSGTSETVFTEFGGFTAVSSGTLRGGTGGRSVGRGQFDLDHAFDPGAGWRGWTGEEYAQTSLTTASQTETLGTDAADWSSRTVQSDPAADGSVTGTITSLSTGDSVLTVVGRATEDLLHTTGHGDLFTRVEDGSVLDTTLTVTGTSHAADDLSYVTDADGETTLDGTSVATSGGGVASTLALTTRLTSRGNTRTGGFAFTVTDYAADSLLETTADATFGAGFDGAYDADGSAVLLFTDSAGGGSTLLYTADGAGGVDSTDDPPEWSNDPEPSSGGGKGGMTETAGGGGGEDFERSEGTYSTHTVRRTANDFWGSESQLRIGSPPRAAGNDGEADPVVTAVTSAAGGFHESGTYDVFDRTWHLEHGSWDGGETEILIDEQGNSGHGHGSNDDEFIDESRAWGDDRADGTWSNGTTLHADGTRTGFALADGDADAGDHSTWTHERIVTNTITITGSQSTSNGPGGPGTTGGGESTTRTTRKSTTRFDTRNRAATADWETDLALVEVGDDAADGGDGGEDAGGTRYGWAGTETLNQTLHTDWDYGTERTDGSSATDGSGAGFGHTDDDRTVETFYAANGDEAVRVVAVGSGAHEATGRTAGGGFGTEFEDRGQWSYAHDLLFAADGDLTGTETNDASGSLTQTTSWLELKNDGQGDGDDNYGEVEDYEVVEETGTHVFSHVATVTHAAGDGAADRTDSESHTRSFTQSRRGAEPGGGGAAEDVDEPERLDPGLTAALGTGAFIESLWTVGAVRLPDDPDDGRQYLSNGDGEMGEPDGEAEALDAEEEKESTRDRMRGMDHRGADAMHDGVPGMSRAAALTGGVAGGVPEGGVNAVDLEGDPDRPPGMSEEEWEEAERERKDREWRANVEASERRIRRENERRRREREAKADSRGYLERAYRWFWAGDSRATDDDLDAALDGAGKSYKDNKNAAHTALDIVGSVPGGGALADVPNAALYALEGDYEAVAEIGAGAGLGVLGDAKKAGDALGAVAGRVPAPGQMNLPFPGGLNDAAAAAGALSQKAADIHDGLDPIARRNRTTSVLRTNRGDIAGGGTRDLTPAQRRIARDQGVTPAALPGKHAEETVLDHARRLKEEPRELFSTRRICPNCREEIEKAGGVLTSIFTAIWR